MRLIAIIPKTALRTVHITKEHEKNAQRIFEPLFSHVFLASKFFWMCGNKFVGPPPGL
jgi:hypothetical protein